MPELQALAPQVCHNCKARKRKCSKELPSCALCLKLLMKCEYEYEDQAQSTVSESSSAAAPPIFDLHVLAKLFAGLSEPSSRAFFDISGMDVSGQVLNSLARSGQSIPSIVAVYYRTIDVWLPVIPEAQIEKSLGSINQDPCIACLLLCMHMITQLPGGGQGRDTMRNQTYFEAKSLHTVQISSGSCSIEVAQAGLLIALYEHGHGILDAARATIASVSRVGSKLVYDKQNTGTCNIADTDVGHLWWGIVIIDRYVNLGVQPREIHFSATLSSNGSKSIELPHDSSDFRPQSCRLYGPSGIARSHPTTKLGPFCRTADASRLLAQVLELISSSSSGNQIDELKSAALDKSLQQLLMALLHQATNGWEECCAAIGLCFSALFSLHEMIWRLSGNGNQEEQKEAAIMTMKTTTRMSIDIARRFHMDLAYIDLPALPLPSTFSLYQSALLHIQFAGDEFMGLEWQSEMESLKSTLAFFAKRWNVGNIYLEQVSVAIAESKRVRAADRTKIYVPYEEAQGL